MLPSLVRKCADDVAVGIHFVHRFLGLAHARTQLFRCLVTFLDGHFCDSTFKNISFRRNCVTRNIETSLAVIEMGTKLFVHTVTNEELAFFTTKAIFQ